MSASQVNASTSILGLNTATVRSVLPILSASLGLLGVGGGIFNFLSPIEGAKGFGITPSSSSGDKSSQLNPTELAYIRIHGIRNISGCLGLLAMCAYLRFSTLCQASTIAEGAVRKLIGITSLAACYVGFVDSWILSEYADSAGVSAQAVELARSKSQGHATLAIPTAIIAVLWLVC